MHWKLEYDAEITREAVVERYFAWAGHGADPAQGGEVAAMLRRRIHDPIAPAQPKPRERPQPVDFLFHHAHSKEPPGFIASAKLRAAMALPPEVADVLPVGIEEPTPAMLAMDYRLVRPKLLVEGADPGRSRQTLEVHWQPDGRKITVLTTERFELSADAAPGIDLFRCYERPTPLIVTEALASRVEATACTGLRFLMPGDHDPARHLVDERLPGGGGVGPRRSRPMGRLPQRDATPVAAFRPTPGLPAGIAEVEQAVQRRLPEVYRRFLEFPPADLLVLGEACKWECWTDPATVAQWNRDKRAPSQADVPWIRGWPLGWPADWLAIGTDGGGNYFLLDLGTGKDEVLFYTHDYGAAVLHSKSLAAYVKHVAARYADD